MDESEQGVDTPNNLDEKANSTPSRNIYISFKNIANKLSGKKLLIVAVIILLLLFLVNLILNRQNLLNQGNKSSGGQVYNLDESKYNQDKGVRIFLKSDITDEEGDAIAQELLKIQGVSGYSLIPVSLQHQYEKYNNLYPQNLSELTPLNHVIIDLYVNNSSYINQIVEDLKNNTNIQAISNISQ